MSEDQQDDVLSGRTFAVLAVAGRAALTVPTAELAFGADGMLSGRATVNRVNGAYRLEAGVLLCGPLMSTLMAGAPDAMEQERRLLDVLAAAPSVRAAPDGAFELVTGDGVTLLREVDADAAVL